MEGYPQSWKNSKLGHEGKTGVLVNHCNICRLGFFLTHMLLLDIQFGSNKNILNMTANKNGQGSWLASIKVFKQVIKRNKSKLNFI